MSFNIRVEDHSREFLDELKRRIPVALEECGLAAEGFAKRLCPVDTGLLHNSITHAISGGPPAISNYTDNPKEQHGEYSGTVPEGDNDKTAMYLGTNVEYAPYVEMGTTRTHEQPFIKPAISDHINDYKRLIENRLKA